jgi:hypothetical protein
MEITIQVCDGCGVELNEVEGAHERTLQLTCDAGSRVHTLRDLCDGCYLEFANLIEARGTKARNSALVEQREKLARESAGLVEQREKLAREPVVEQDWIEIGKRCSAGRRSLWARWIYRREPTEEETEIGARVVSIEDVEAVELSAGREGGDAFIRIDCSNPQFAELENLLSVARFAATT